MPGGFHQRRRIWIPMLLLVAVLLTSLAATLFARLRGQGSGDTLPIQRGDLIESVYGLGTVTPNRSFQLKIGVISAFSGQFADTSAQIDNGIKLYMKQHGDTVAGKKIEIIRKDTGGPNPDVAKRLAQELIVRDKADILAGFALTPEALGAAGVSAEAKKFMVDMNAATSIITEKSPYIVRVSLTLPQIGDTLGKWAATKGKIKKTYTMVTDFGPGIDAETSFQKAFKEAGGEVVGSVRMPIANPDFSAFVQRAKDLNPESIFVFIPGGAQPAGVADQAVNAALRYRTQAPLLDALMKELGLDGPMPGGLAARLSPPAEEPGKKN